MWNYHGFIHVLINLSSLYQSLVQLLEHDRAISYPLNFNLLNILLLGGSGPGKRGGGGGGGGGGGCAVGLTSGLGHGPSNFFKSGPARPVDWSTGIKDGPDSGLRPNFSGPGGPAQPVGDPYV